MVKIMINNQEWTIEELREETFEMLSYDKDSQCRCELYHICINAGLSESKKVYLLKKELTKAFKSSFSTVFVKPVSEIDLFDFVALYGEQIIQCAYYCLEHMNDDLKPKEAPPFEKE